MSGLRRLIDSWRSRVTVTGHSMVPTLRDGDWVLVDPTAYRLRPPSPGEMVVAESPDGPLLKRVSELVGTASVLLAGDAPSAGQHSHDVVVAVSAVSGRPWFRYWPARGIGRVR